MANSSPPSQPPPFSSLLLLLSTTAAAAAGPGTTTITAHFQELETMLQVLRNNGYTLFTNAIATSDVQYQLANTTASSAAAAEISAPPFTLFAPVDELLFALDLSAEADANVSTLRYHVIPNRRHTFAELRSLTSPFLETLLPHYSVLIGRTRGGPLGPFDNATVGVMVDGVRLSDPDLFLGSRIVVHGIDGILLTGLNMNHQFDRNENGSGRFAPTGTPPSVPESGRNVTSKGTPPPATHSKERKTVAPVTSSEKKKRRRITTVEVGSVTAGGLGDTGTAIIAGRTCRLPCDIGGKGLIVMF